MTTGEIHGLWVSSSRRTCCSTNVYSFVVYREVGWWVPRRIRVPFPAGWAGYGLSNRLRPMANWGTCYGGRRACFLRLSTSHPERLVRGSKHHSPPNPLL